MSKWDKLSMSDRAKYIQLAVQNGVTDLSKIKSTYNTYSEGKDIYSAGRQVDAIYNASIRDEGLGNPSHNYDFTMSEEWANQHGYYPDSRGHRDDRVKKPAHPTHPSRGTFNSTGDRYELSERGIEDPNYTLFGLVDGNQDPQATMTYKNSIVLPEITVTPKGNYVYNSYDNRNIYFNKGGRINRYDDEGYKGEFIPVQEVPTYAWNNNTLIEDRSGNTRKFSDVLRTDPNYKVLVDPETSKLVTKEYLLSDEHKPSQDVIENQMSSITRQNTGVDLYQGQAQASERYKQALNEASIFSDLRVKNYQNALRRNPNFGDNWNLFNNVVEGFNVLSGGALNRLSPTQNIGLIIDAINGKNIGDSLFGNSGIVSEEWARENPIGALLINGVGDAASYAALLKGYNAYKAYKDPRSDFNMRRGLKVKSGKELNQVLTDLQLREVNKKLAGLDLREELGSQYANELKEQGLIDNLNTTPTVSKQGHYYIRTNHPWYSSNTGVNRVYIGDLPATKGNKVFMSYGEPWMEFKTAPTVHEFPFETFGPRSSVDYWGNPTGVDVRDVYNGIGYNSKGRLINPRNIYEGNQLTVSTDEYNRAFLNSPHTTYERRMIDGFPYVQEMHYTPVRNNKPYINNKGIPMKHPPSIQDEIERETSVQRIL